MYHIDKYYQNVYLDSLARLNSDTYIHFMSTEIENFYNEKSHIQQLCETMRKREETIKHLKEEIKNLSQEKIEPDVRERVIYILYNR